MMGGRAVFGERRVVRAGRIPNIGDPLKMRVVTMQIDHETIPLGLRDDRRRCDRCAQAVAADDRFVRNRAVRIASVAVNQ